MGIKNGQQDREKIEIKGAKFQDLSVTGGWANLERAVNRQPGFRPEDS